MSSVSDARTRMQESYDLERAQSREAHERESKEKSQNYEEELQSRKEEYNQRLLAIRDEAQTDVRKLKENMYDRQGKSQSSEAMAIRAEREQINRFKEEVERDAEKKINRIDRMAQERALKSTEGENSRVEKAIAAQQKSQRQEVSALERELDQYRNMDRDLGREKAQAKQGTIEEYEGDRIKERERIVDAYERSIAKLKEKQDELGEHYERRLTESNMSTDEKANGRIRAQKEEFTKAERERRQEMNRVEERFNQEIRKEQTRNERTTNTLITQSSGDKEKALQNKDATYQEYLKENKAKNDYERQARDQEITMLRTTSDSTKVSPYVVDKIEKGAEMRYYTALKETTDLNNKKLAALRERDVGDRQDMQQKFQESLTDRSRQMQRGQDVEKKQFLAAFDDLQHLRADEKSDLEKRYNDTLMRTHTKQALATALGEKKKRDEMEEQRMVLNGDKVQLEDELTVKHKMENRQWAGNYNALRRDFQTKMNDERDQHEIKVNELRFEFDKRLRDKDRNANRALDDRVKMYEHQIKQQELAFKEKERFLTERYEEELDRMRATNARLIQKKS